MGAQKNLIDGIDLNNATYGFNEDGSVYRYPHSFTVEQLEDLIEFVHERPIETMSDVASAFNTFGEEVYKGYVTIRHDVDHNLDHALKMARYEHDCDVKASYYILHTAWYYADFDHVCDVMSEMRSLGHEVGLHHDVMSLASADFPSGSKDQVRRVALHMLNVELDALRENGFTIETVAAHGGVVSGMLLWDGVMQPSYFRVSEAYLVNHNLDCNYISDNKGAFEAPLVHKDGRPTHLLVHPEHWALA